MAKNKVWIAVMLEKKTKDRLVKIKKLVKSEQTMSEFVESMLDNVLAKTAEVTKKD